MVKGEGLTTGAGRREAFDGYGSASQHSPENLGGIHGKAKLLERPVSPEVRCAFLASKEQNSFHLWLQLDDSGFQAVKAFVPEVFVLQRQRAIVTVWQCLITEHAFPHGLCESS